MATQWDMVGQLYVDDVVIGDRILMERKTTDDFLASLDDGRLFRQARGLASSTARPVVIQEGDVIDLTPRVDAGAYRGELLALFVGFRIPVLTPRDVREMV